MVDTDSEDQLEEDYSEPESMISPRKQPSPRKRPRLPKLDAKEPRNATPRTATTAHAGGTGKAPRRTKKAREAEERQRREAYARTLFQELNATVFDNALPEDTPLRWNNRLLTTAGRACYRK